MNLRQKQNFNLKFKHIIGIRMRASYYIRLPEFSHSFLGFPYEILLFFGSYANIGEAGFPPFFGRFPNVSIGFVATTLGRSHHDRNHFAQLAWKPRAYGPVHFILPKGYIKMFRLNVFSNQNTINPGIMFAYPSRPM